jgi:hypothetical protein
MKKRIRKKRKAVRRRFIDFLAARLCTPPVSLRHTGGFGLLLRLNAEPSKTRLDPLP